MAMASGIGVELVGGPSEVPAHAFWFGEDQARYVVTVPAGRESEVMARAADANVPLRRLGTTGSDMLELPGERPTLVKALVGRFEGWLPTYMAGRSS
jgi:phosphoribosylformylglycinamidine synthase